MRANQCHARDDSSPRDHGSLELAPQCSGSPGTKNSTVRLIALALLTTAAAAQPSPISGRVFAQQSVPTLIADFSSGWTDRWMHIKLDSRATHYTVIKEDGERVLQARSDSSASGLWYTVNIEPIESGVISWRWKIDHTIPDNRSEREKQGDDYAARLFVVFDDEPFSDESRALCYVWASSEPAGSTFPNPYLPSVMMIVLESGDARAGEWVAEERDFVHDYKEAFGEPPQRVSAIAVMVDTDDTASETVAWFGDVRLAPGPSASAAGEAR